MATWRAAVAVGDDFLFHGGDDNANKFSDGWLRTGDG
jgi:hypothetical protein